MIRIIDNKKINLTNDEYNLYLKICKSYDTPRFKGQDLFRDLFETDDNGIIIFLKPPSKNYSSFEVFMFLVSIMVHQHLGIACEKVDSQIIESKKIMNELKENLEEIKIIKESLKNEIR